jgi:hypothetical protein
MPPFDFENISAFFPLYNLNDRCSGKGNDEGKDLQIVVSLKRISVRAFFTIPVVIGRIFIFSVVSELVTK